MNKYFATFFSHFGAMTYCKSLTKQGIDAKLMPVPRKLSSSCGTSVYYEHTFPVDSDDCELECIYLEKNGVFADVIRKGT